MVPKSTAFDGIEDMDENGGAARKTPVAASIIRHGINQYE
jgi:hypothetical protein